MGIVSSKVISFVRRFNIENRAHRVIELDKLPAAPRYKSFELELKKAQELGFDERIHLKNHRLDMNLKDVYLKSFNDNSDFSSGGKRPRVSRERFISNDPLISHKESDVIPEGKCTVKQALKFLTDYRGNPFIYDGKIIAKEYKLPEEVVENILKYFSAFELFEPERKTMVKVAKPATNKKTIKEELIKKLSEK